MRNRKRITLGALAAATALGGAVAFAGVTNILSPASAGNDKPVAAQNAAQTSQVAQQGKARGSTVVTFTEGAVAALAPLNPTGLKPGAFGLSPDGQTVQGVFPIVGNGAGGVVDHVGGLALTTDANALVLRNFKIDTTTGVLTANGAVNGEPLSRIDFLNVSPSATPQAGCAVTADLTLAKPAADALVALFDAPDLTGAAIGTACVTPR